MKDSVRVRRLAAERVPGSDAWRVYDVETGERFAREYPQLWRAIAAIRRMRASGELDCVLVRKWERS